ncbi:MAG: glycosyltransferase family 9 protein [Bacteroidetes bacterium]|nr:glycosyltransferase family 9 protein [Bacteroidota bacterium]
MIYKKIDYLFRSIILYLVDLLKLIYLKPADILVNFIPCKTQNKNLCLIKTDEIGDYVLFRNFIEILKKDNKYKGYKIILLGNITWKNLAEELDGEFVDEFIWIDKNNFLTNLLYRYRFLKKFSSKNPEILINCSYSRNFYLDDSIAAVTSASQKISFKTDLSNSYKWQILISNKYYSTLVDSSNEVFDFYKYRSFFENLLQTKIDLIKPQINLNDESNLVEIYNDYVIFFTGGRRKYKKWKLDYFIDTANFIISKYNMNILLVGTEQEAKDNNLLYNQIEHKEKVKDLSGQTSLTELVSLLNKAKLLITNDSGIVHIAASVNTKTIVILNGSQFGRFLPYPNELGVYISTLYPAAIMENLSEVNFLYKKFQYRSLLDINSIQPEQVKNEIEIMMTN